MFMTFLGAEIISRKDFFAHPEYSLPKVSPNGKQVAYIAPYKGVLNIWIGGKKISEIKEAGLSSFFWSKDNKKLFYLKDKDCDFRFHIYTIDLEKNETKDLTPDENINAKVLHISKKHPQKIAVGLNKRNPKFHDVYVLDLETGKADLIYKNEKGYLSFFMDDDFQIKLKVKYQKDSSAEVHDEAEKVILKFNPDDAFNTDFLEYNSDEKILYFLDNRNSDKTKLSAFYIRSCISDVIGEGQKADIDRDVLFLNGKPAAYANTYLKKEWKVLDQTVCPIFKNFQDGEISIVSQSDDGNFWTVRINHPQKGINYYIFDKRNNTKNEIGRAYPKLQCLSPMYPIEIKSSDGYNLVSYLSLPRENDQGNFKPKKPLPLILLVHGGPFKVRDYWRFDPHHQWLTNRGYAVLSVNYRLSGGFGKKFTNIGHGEWSRNAHRDLLEAVDWAVKNKITTKDQVAIMGGSYGGYAALVGATFTPEKFVCAVDLVGPSNLKSVLATCPENWELPDRTSYGARSLVFSRNMFERSCGKSDDELALRSPINYVDQIKIPLFIGHGANDHIVKKAESDQIVEVMKKKNIPGTYLVFADEGHGFKKEENAIALYACIEEFLAGHLKGKIEHTKEDIQKAKQLTVDTF